jgi:hypothetical protein
MLEMRTPAVTCPTWLDRAAKTVMLLAGIYALAITVPV